MVGVFFYFHNIWGRGHNNKILLRAPIWPAAALIKMSPQSAFEEILLHLATAHILSAAVLAPPYQYTVQRDINKKIFWRRWKTKQLLVHIDFDSREHCGPATVWFSTFFKIAFMFSRRMKLGFKINFEWVNEGIKIKQLCVFVMCIFVLIFLITKIK